MEEKDEKKVVKQELNEDDLEMVTGGEEFPDGIYGFKPEESEGSNGVEIPSVLPKTTPEVTGFFPLKMNLRHLVPGQRSRFWPSINQFNCPTNI